MNAAPPTPTYSIGSIQLSPAEFFQVLSQFSPLQDIATSTRIKGPFDGKINTIYQIAWANGPSYIFRARISKAFRYEPIVKEKILYPFLDGTLTAESQSLEKKIRTLTECRQGKYVFSTQRPAIVPVQDMPYYYEPAPTPENSATPIAVDLLPPKPFPYLLTIKTFVPGKSLYDILQQIPPEQVKSPAVLAAFEQAGELLAKLHTVRFDAFYEKITDIGSPNKPSWSTLFARQWRQNFADASQYKGIALLLPAIERYYKDRHALAEADTEAVLFHNDYQSQNLIVQENASEPWTSPKKYPITAIIDFDNWRIGPRAQDFVKMEYWTIQNNALWKEAFYRGYAKSYPIKSELKERVNLYKLLWFLLVYAFEMDKIKKNELNLAVDARFPAADKYLFAIKSIVESQL